MKRPIVKLRLSRMDVAAEAVGWAVVIAHWAFVAWHYADLPEIIPRHFNARGEADGFGAKGGLLDLPIINTVLFAGMTLLNRFPQAFNYLEDITADNAEQQYRAATRLIRYLKLAVAVLFFVITYSTVETAYHGESPLMAWVLPMLGVSTFGLLLYFLAATRTNRK